MKRTDRNVKIIEAVLTKLGSSCRYIPEIEGRDLIWVVPVKNLTPRLAAPCRFLEVLYYSEQEESFTAKVHLSNGYREGYDGALSDRFAYTTLLGWKIFEPDAPCTSYSKRMSRGLSVSWTAFPLIKLATAWNGGYVVSSFDVPNETKLSTDCAYKMSVVPHVPVHEREVRKGLTWIIVTAVQSYAKLSSAPQIKKTVAEMIRKELS